jgi:hypothetical protein
LSTTARSIVVLALFVGGSVTARAQIPNCGNVDVSHTMRQTPNYKKSVDVTAVTSRTYTLCPLEVQTEVWVDALSTYITSKRGTYIASANQTRSVPSYGTWHSTAKHWLIGTATGTWTDAGRTYGSTLVEAPPSAGSTCDIGPSDCIDGYQFKPGFCACVTLSPILVDTAGDGFRLTSAQDGVEFDLDDNGQANERVAWTEPESDDAWLVMDRNGNGAIDSGAELFGSRTPAYADSLEPRTENGFDALFMAEGPSYGGGMPDRVIDARDAVYSRLRLWFDRNHDGRTDAGELVTLPDAGVRALDSRYKEIGRRDQYGNRFNLKGRAVFAGPGGQALERTIYDVFLTVWPTADARVTGQR